MSEWVCESPLGVSTSNLSYPMFAVNWPRGHVNTRANKSMTTVSVIEDISDIVSISRGFMEYPHPLHMLWRHSLNSVTAYSKPYRLNHCVRTLIQLHVYFKIILQHSSMTHLIACLDVSIELIIDIVSMLIQHCGQLHFRVDVLCIHVIYFEWGLNSDNNLKWFDSF